MNGVSKRGERERGRKGRERESKGRGEEKVRVHMNVMPRSIGNTNSGTEN